MLPPAHLIFAVLVMSVVCHYARAQNNVELSAMEIPKPGVAGAIPASVAFTSGASDVVSLFSFVTTKEVLATHFKEEIPHTRGPQDISLFHESAPSVVLAQSMDLALALCCKIM
jgi:hypothetical protein